MTKIRAAVFDLAGTVIDHGSRAPVLAFVEAFASKGIVISISDARGPMGMAKRDHIRSILELSEVSRQWEKKTGRVFDQADIDELYVDFLPVQERLISQHDDFIPGVDVMITEIERRGIRYAATTGYTQKLVGLVAPGAATQGFRPAEIFNADTPCEGRPAPWMIHRACELLGVYPMCCVVNLDDTTVGVAAGRNAGCWSIGISLTGNLLGLSHEEAASLQGSERVAKLRSAEEKLLAAGAHLVIESAAELPQAVDRIETVMAMGVNPSTEHL